LNHLAVGVTQVGVQLTIISICHSVHQAGSQLTAKFQLPRILFQFIVFMFVQLTNVSCLPLNVAKSSFVKYQSALAEADHNLVLIVAVVSSQVLVQLRLPTFTLSQAVMNKFLDHCVISSESVIASCFQLNVTKSSFFR
jgi:hypothetical protein